MEEEEEDREEEDREKEEEEGGGGETDQWKTCYPAAETYDWSSCELSWEMEMAEVTPMQDMELNERKWGKKRICGRTQKVSNWCF